MKFLRAALLILLFIVLGFLLAAWVSSLSINGPSGLAGPGIVVGSGLFGAAGGVLMAVLILTQASKKKIVLINTVVGLIILILIIFLIGKFKSNEAKKELPAPKPEVKPINFSQKTERLGLGLAGLDIHNTTVFYFYNPNLGKALDEHLPTDSITFVKTELGVEISTAPPWLYPEHMKLDYDLLYFKVISITQDWVQLEVNKQTGRMAWVNAFSINVRFWAEFLLTTHSIETIDFVLNPIRIKPVDHSSIIQNENQFLLQPLEIRDNWLRVRILDEKSEKQNEGWLKWRNERELLIRYSLLS